MITNSAASVSDQLSFEEALTKLRASSFVDGIAEFGSRSTTQVSAASDYDLLILVKDLPAPVFQMVTTIGARLADIVLVETDTADKLLTQNEPPRARTFEALFAQKMKTARIHHDAAGRLQRVQQLVTGPTWSDAPPKPESELYAAWFWLSHGLLHLERMVQSENPIHLSAVDMMLTSCLPEAWRNYFGIRNLVWEGEKAALRYWAEHDTDYLGLVRACLELTDRNEKVAAYRKLVDRTLDPIAPRLNKGETAVMLTNTYNRVDLQATLKYWDALFSGNEKRPGS